MNRINLEDITLNVIERGSGPPLLLVHGFPLDHQMWRGQIDELAEDFRVIAPICAASEPAMRPRERSPCSNLQTTWPICLIN